MTDNYSIVLKSENSKYITWIKESRKEGMEWNQIYLGGKKTVEELLNFFKLQKELNRWDMNQDKWIALCNAQKYVEEHETSMIIPSNDEEEKVLPNSPGSCWKKYREKLINNGFSDASIYGIENSTQKVFARLRNKTLQNKPILGITVGDVQSGKTANMAALMAVAADYGYNMFIVLTGTIDNLRIQTQNRLINDLSNGNGNLIFKLIENPSIKSTADESLQNLYLESDDKIRYLTVCLKNTKRLKDLIKWLNSNEKKEKLKILIIDDEADQAGINTANITKNLKTKIHSLIKNLVYGRNYDGSDARSYSALNYIAYTATPYANFLNEARDETLYPKDFISTLSSSNEYFGPKQIFGYNDDDYPGLPIINIISQEDIEKIKMKSIEIPNSLKDAICWFICTIAIFRKWNLQKPLTMLVHTSQKQSQHFAMEEAIKAFIISSISTLKSSIKSVYNKQTDLLSISTFKSSYQDYGRESINNYPSFEEIEPFIDEILEEKISEIRLDDEGELIYSKGINICVDNCKANKNEENIHLRLVSPNSKEEKQKSLAFIVVGGSTLSRGLTLEGLTCSYFLRVGTMADTLMQMGRWFGYRRNYELLPRIWMSDKTRTQFIWLTKLNEDLKNELYQMEIKNQKPQDYAPRIDKLPEISMLRITDKKKSQSMVDANYDFSNSSAQTLTLYKDNDILKSNFEATKNFINSLGSINNDLINKLNNKNAINANLWFNCENEDVFEFLKSLKYPIQNSLFTSIDSLNKWIKKAYENDNLPKWNIYVSSNKEGSDEEYLQFNNCSIFMPSRTPLKEESKNSVYKFKGIDARFERFIDIDVTSITDINVKNQFNQLKKAKIVRANSAQNSTPILRLYLINPQSKTRDDTNHMSLNAPCPLVAYSLYIPYEIKIDNFRPQVHVKLQYTMDSNDLVEDEDNE